MTRHDGACLLMPELKWQRQADLCEVKAILGYIVSSRLAQAKECSLVFVFCFVLVWFWFVCLFVF